MLEKIKHPLVILLIKFTALYLLWFLFYDVWLRSPSDTFMNGEKMPEKTSALDEWVIIQTTITSKGILEIFGHEIFYDGFRTIGIEGSAGLWVGDSCNAITLIALFTGMILIFSGSWWKKLIYILLGGITIWFLNVLRIVFLAILDLHSKSLAEFNHTYTFTIIVYAYIIFLWYLWLKKFSIEKTTVNDQAE